MGLRDLNRDDAGAVHRFVLMAALPPGWQRPPEATEVVHVRRWLDGWGSELGVGWDEHGALVGAAWARHVEPVVVLDDVTGEPLAEVIVAVAEEARRTGLGRKLMEGLLARARAADRPGLALTVSERNPVAVRLYERVGFAPHGRTPTGLLTMVSRPRPHTTP